MTCLRLQVHFSGAPHYGPLWSTWGACLGEGKSGVEVRIVSTNVARRADTSPLVADCHVLVGGREGKGVAFALRVLRCCVDTCSRPCAVLQTGRGSTEPPRASSAPRCSLAGPFWTTRYCLPHARQQTARL